MLLLASALLTISVTDFTPLFSVLKLGPLFGIMIRSVTGGDEDFIVQVRFTSEPLLISVRTVVFAAPCSKNGPSTGHKQWDYYTNNIFHGLTTCSLIYNSKWQTVCNNDIPYTWSVKSSSVDPTIFVTFTV